MGKIYKKIIKHFFKKTYAKKIGIDLNKVHIYGDVDFGTEPWIISFGNNVHITDGVKFITHDGGVLILRKNFPDLDITKPITIGNDVYIGNNALIMPGVKIGDRVIIGAGAVVTKDVETNSVVVGIPAAKIKTVDDYLDKAIKHSTKTGNLSGKIKDDKLKDFFSYKGNSKGIYF